jgi:hypothetical protein
VKRVKLSTFYILVLKAWGSTSTFPSVLPHEKEPLETNEQGVDESLRLLDMVMRTILVGDGK